MQYLAEGLDYVVKLFTIMALASIIGYNRGSNSQGAGMRTHVLVGLGAALSMMISIKGIETFTGSTYDPFRLSAQVISGIGFLGAGTIIKTGQTIKGLTTAASLWAIAMIGIAIGSGFYVMGIVAFMLVHFSLVFLSRINHYLLSKVGHATVLVTFVYSQANFNHILNYLHDNNIVLLAEQLVFHHKSENDVKAMLRLDVKTRKGNTELNKIMNDLITIDSILKIDYLNETERI